MFWIIAGFTDLPRCAVCGKPVTRNVFTTELGYVRKEYLLSDPQIITCSDPACAQKNPLSRQYKREYFQSKYGNGITNPFQADSVKQLCVQQHLKNLGVSNPSYSPIVIDKIRKSRTAEAQKYSNEHSAIAIRRKSYRFIVCESINRINFMVCISKPSAIQRRLYPVS